MATSPAPPPPDDEDDIFIDDGGDDNEPSAALPPHVELPPPDDDEDVLIDNGDDDDAESLSAAAPPAPPDQQEQSDSDVEVTGVIGGDLDATVPTPAVLALDQAVLEGGESSAESTESESFGEASHSAEPTTAPKRRSGPFRTRKRNAGNARAGVPSVLMCQRALLTARSARRAAAGGSAPSGAAGSRRRCTHSAASRAPNPRASGTRRTATARRVQQPLRRC